MRKPPVAGIAGRSPARPALYAEKPPCLERGDTTRRYPMDHARNLVALPAWGGLAPPPPADTGSRGPFACRSLRRTRGNALRGDHDLS
jgi:hypothetical protein